MNMTPELIASLDRLNPEQHEAVECLDGPLLVIAGPGTGKTQLLSRGEHPGQARCRPAQHPLPHLYRGGSGSHAQALD